MRDNTKLPEYDDGAPCPVHGSPCYKVYEFGFDAVATVTTFRGCRCAVGHQYDPCGSFQYDARYFRSYAQAAGLAELVKMDASARFGGPMSGLG